ncbi:peptidase domain-containing ABC transporter [Halobacillus sp. MO56]
MAKINYTEQMEHSECGLACLAMVLSFFNKHISLAKIRETFGVPRGGTSLTQLIDMGREYGLEGKGMKAGAQELFHAKMPVIAHWEGKHYVVVEKIRKRKVTILDPATGKQKVPYDEFNEKYTGYCLWFQPDNDFQENQKPSYVSFFLSFALKHKKWVVAILAVSLVLQLFGLAIPFVTQWMTDSIIMKQNDDPLTIIGIGMLVTFLCYQCFSFIRGFFIARLQTLIDSLMMSKFILHLFRLPYAFFQNRPGGELLFRANSHVMIRQILSNSLVTFLIDGILLFSYAALMLWHSWSMGILVISIGLTIFITLLLSTNITRKLTNNDVSAQAKVQSFLSESIHGVCDVKMMGIEKNVFKNWRQLFHEQLKASEKKSIWTSLLHTITRSTQFILPVFLLWYGSFLVIGGDMTLGALLGFNSLATVFIVPIVSIGTGYTELLYLTSYIRRIYDVFETEPEQEDDNSHRLKSPSFKEEISFRNVSFQYDRLSSPVLKDINLTISPQEKVAIVGASGSGKSTIAKLLLGLYQPTQGDIFIDGHSINEYRLAGMRKQMGAVLQETRLFNQTIAHNILPKDSGEFDLKDYEDIAWAAKAANIHEEIMKTAIGYQTMISESGKNFSGGQRQRLLLARALVHKPSLLILDEATSSLDMKSEAKIEKTISSINCTQVIIAHRLSTIKNVDRILVMDNGRLVEEGTHNSLLRKQGIYHSLYTTQEERKEETLYADSI